MDVLALGNAPTAVIAVVAIVLGVVLLARGRRGERAAGLAAAGQAGPSPSTVPIAVAEPATDAGLQTMAVGEVGHGAIRLGGVSREPEPVSATDESSGAAPFRQGTIKLRKPSGD